MEKVFFRFLSRIIATFIAIASPRVTGAQLPDSPPLPAAQPVAVLPFDFNNNEIVVAVTINDSKESLHFILDSGTGTNIISKETAERFKLRLRDYPLFSIFGIKVRKRVRGVGYGDKGYLLQYAERIRMSIASTTGSLPLASSNYMVTALPPLQKGDPTDGILGHPFLSRYIVAIDYVQHMVTLYERKEYQYKGNGQSIPLKVEEKYPTISVQIKPLVGEPFLAKMILDTGNGDKTLLNTALVNRRKLLTTTKTNPLDVTGPTGRYSGRTGRLEFLSIGNYPIAHPSVLLFQSTGGESGTKDRDGNIGNTILSRFHVVLDLSGRRLFLEPNSQFEKPFPPLFYSGLSSKLESDGLHITSVDADSPATSAGFLVGDTILAVDDVLVADLSRQIPPITLLDDKSHSYQILRDGKEITLKMQRIAF